MKLPGKFIDLFRVPPLLTRTRILLALGVAIAADGLQILLGPLGWALPDQVIDLVTTILVMKILGFHILLLPTFVIELVPVVEDLPTWTAGVAAVIALRKRKQRTVAPAIPPAKPTIEI